jgi:hypothetical protein
MINSGDEGSMVLTIRGAGSGLRYSRNEGEEGGARYQPQIQIVVTFPLATSLRSPECMCTVHTKTHESSGMRLTALDVSAVLFVDPYSKQRRQPSIFTVLPCFLRRTCGPSPSQHGPTRNASALACSLALPRHNAHRVTPPITPDHPMSDLPNVLPSYNPSNTRLQSLFEACDLTTTELLFLDPTDISRRCTTPHSAAPSLLEIKRYVTNLAAALNGDIPDATGRDVKESETYLTTGDESIDALLGGGVQVGGITEFVGER